ncbi:glycosyltransferase family 4 protein [Microbacterium lushaniae]|uniref:D-inositol 3-phosphate glycosyltransferase n=1 Tax=Microbacterium lushaniae TaxID=2614639 RepID=A0A5J6L0Z2_9MICO|nr:glycosyltransferase family 4 protein [Microbacterium lushaniae]QEW02158.1 glycosyltransferase family 4 protein [Microbacterium lushaniae]
MAATPEFEHHLLYAERADAPIVAADLSRFTTATALPPGHGRRARATRSHLRRKRFDIVHAHSSFGGLYARVAARRARTLIVYTPHCYAFERKDIGALQRLAFRLTEFFLAFNTSVFAACSPREAQLSRWTPGTRVVFVPNVAPRAKAVDVRPNGTPPLRVVGAGRAARQKDPEFFLACIREARRQGVEVDATWVGGDSTLQSTAEADGVTVTGWLPREEALRHVRTADIYLHTAAWEGFPVAVLEAVALGVPTVVRRIPAFESLDLPQFTSATEFADVAGEAQDPRLRRILLSRAEVALSDYTPETQRLALLSAYHSGITK